MRGPSTGSDGRRPEGIAFRLAWMYAQLGDAEGYRRTCADLLKRFQQTKNARNAYLLARICLLAPGGVVDLAVPLRLSELAVRANPRFGWYLHTRALADCRAGQFDQAIGWAQRSMEADPAWNAHIVNWLVLSMAHHRLGDAEEAHEWLDKRGEKCPKIRLAFSNILGMTGSRANFFAGRPRDC